MEDLRSGFSTRGEPHPAELVEGGTVNKNVGIKELRDSIPAYCFTPSIFWSFFYLCRDLVYSAILIFMLRHTLSLLPDGPYQYLYYPVVISYGFIQGLVWTGLWVIAHECGHSAFSTNSILNDIIGWTLHSALLAPYFSWKSTHRRHHIYAGHMDKDLNYVPLRRDTYAAKIGLKPGELDGLGEDAPIVLFLRILLQQVIGWNWYILSNITCPPTALVKQGMSIWRHSHFDPWGSQFRNSEATSIILSDIGCLLTITTLYRIYLYLGSFEQLFWLYVVPWMWVNHWIVMITYLHHTSPKVPKYKASSWTFVRGATATIDRDFGIIGTHFFHNISSDHVTHHLFSKIPHYYAPVATAAIVPLLGKQYHDRGSFTYGDLKEAFSKCQWVEENEVKDKELGLATHDDGKVAETDRALWYRAGVSPAPEFRMREGSNPDGRERKLGTEDVKPKVKIGKVTII